MENYFVYNDPIRIVWRKGNAEEPYVDKVESQKVINNMVVLTEIPDEFTHVSINGYTEIYEGTPSATQFIVNYENGIITFNPSKEGVTITNMTYKGRGFILYPASRIYGHNENPDVVITLQQIIDAGDIALDALAKLVVVIANAEAATAKAITQADYAKTQGDYAKAQGDYSKSSGDALVFKGTYAAATAYVARNMVYYNGATYMATANTTGNVPTNVSFWKKIGSMVWKGTYSTAVTYTYGDFVTDGTNYNLYMSIFETNTNQPLTNVSYWNKMISVQTVAEATVLATTNANTATTQANNARDAANAAKAAADTATGLANTATANANTATTQANTARDGANTAASAANTAKAQADTARDSANAAALAANTAKTNADTATGLANAATSAANTATGLANTATTQANAARDGANTAKDAANAATTAANTAKTNADTATTQANAARDSANTAATNANTKADYAQTQGNYAKDVGDSLVHKGDYSASLAYVPRNMVYYNGVTYMCIANSAIGVLPTSPSYWRKIVAFNWKGTYSTATTYQYGDFVVDTTNQKLYICVKDGTTNIALTTTANWNPIFDISTVITTANTAITQANAARDAANAAKTAADTATTQANAARDAANTAKTEADTAALNANTLGDYAKTQGDYAKAQGGAASTATTAANTATTQANAARDAANTAKTNADTATTAANAATTNANNAATAANTAKTNADTATGLANTATTNANNAATNANTVAGRMTAKGVYSASVTYYPNNVVTYNGSSYMCTVQALNKVPTDTGFWQLLAIKGNDGLGSVANIISSNNDISISGTADTPNLAINTTLKSLWNDKYTKSEVDTLLNQATSNIQWKASVANFAAIATTYPNPQDGWTVNVNDTDYTYRYTGSAWIAISANSIPLASSSNDGKMSTNMYDKVNGISGGANRVINSSTNGNILIDGVENSVYAHPTGAGNNHIPTGGATDNFLKYSASGTAVWATPTLVGLSDTTITSPATSQVLRYNGTNWTNAALTFADIAGGTSGALVSNFNADMVDGYHLNQDVRTTATPSFTGLELYYQTLKMRLPTSGASWARGFLFQNETGATEMGGIGVYGATTNALSLYMALGTNPWSNLKGLYVSPDGRVGIGKNTAMSYTLDVVGNIGATNYVSTAAEGTAPLQVNSSTLVTRLNADLLDGKHSTSFTRRIALDGQLQLTSYRRSVIALCELTNTNPSANSYSMGTLTAHRPNAVTPFTTMIVGAEKVYSTTKFNFTMLLMGSGNSAIAGAIRPCSFTYNGIKYGGIDFFSGNAELSQMTFNGEGNFEVFGVDYLVTNTSAVLIQEIYDSLNITDDHVYLSEFTVGNRRLTASPDASSIVLRDSEGLISGTRLYASVANGTSPLIVNSTTLVTNLNADFVDGLHVSAGSAANTIVARDANQDIFVRRGTFNAANGVVPLVITSQTMVPNLNADMVDGYHMDQNVLTTSAPTFRGVLLGSGGIVLVAPPTAVDDAGDIVFQSNDGTQKARIWTTPSAGAGLFFATGDNVQRLIIDANGVVKTGGGAILDDGSGNSTFRTIKSNVAQGTAPLVTASTTLVTNLNADMVDGFHLNQDVTTTAKPTFAGAFFNGNVSITSAAPILSFAETDQALNEKFWWLVADGKCLQFRTVTDAAGTGMTAMNIVRGTGTAVTTVLFPNLPVGAASFTSTVAQGVAPLSVTSTTMVANFNAHYVNGYTAMPTSNINTIPVRDATKKIAEVSATRANTSQLTMPTANAPINIISYAPTIKANFTVYFYMTIKEACTVEVKITYSDNGGASSQTIWVQPSKTLTPDSYSYFPVYLTAIPVGSISVVVTTTNSTATVVSATIKEE